MDKRNLNIQFFDSFEDEARAEYDRRSKQTSEERMKEFSILQQRCWGEKWTKNRIESHVSFEEVSW